MTSRTSTSRSQALGVAGGGDSGALTTGFQERPGSGVPPAVGREQVTCCPWRYHPVLSLAPQGLSMVLKGALVACCGRLA